MIIEGLFFGAIILMISIVISLFFIGGIFIIMNYPLDLKTSILIFGFTIIAVASAAYIGNYLSPYDTWSYSWR